MFFVRGAAGLLKVRLPYPCTVMVAGHIISVTPRDLLAIRCPDISLTSRHHTRRGSRFLGRHNVVSRKRLRHSGKWCRAHRILRVVLNNYVPQRTSQRRSRRCMWQEERGFRSSDQVHTENMDYLQCALYK